MISLNLKHIRYVFPKTYYTIQFKLIITVSLNIQHFMHILYIFPQTYYNLVCILLVIINLQPKILENSLINLSQVGSTLGPQYEFKFISAQQCMTLYTKHKQTPTELSMKWSLVMFFGIFVDKTL